MRHFEDTTFVETSESDYQSTERHIPAERCKNTKTSDAWLVLSSEYRVSLLPF